MSGLFYTWDSIHRIQGDESERILDCLYKMFLQLLKYGDLTVLSKIPKEMKSYIISYINIPFHMQKMTSINDFQFLPALTALFPRFLTLHSRITVLPTVVYTRLLLVLTKYGGDSASISL